jgi:hypothetical protein
MVDAPVYHSTLIKFTKCTLRHLLICHLKLFSDPARSKLDSVQVLIAPRARPAQLTTFTDVASSLSTPCRANPLPRSKYNFEPTLYLPDSKHNTNKTNRDYWWRTLQVPTRHLLCTVEWRRLCLSWFGARGSHPSIRPESAAHSMYPIRRIFVPPSIVYCLDHY